MAGSFPFWRLRSFALKSQAYEAVGLSALLAGCSKSFDEFSQFRTGLGAFFVRR
jgi:hypothetical protein